MGERTLKAWACAALILPALLLTGCGDLLRMPVRTEVREVPPAATSTPATVTAAETDTAATAQPDAPAPEKQPAVAGAPPTTALHKPGFDSSERKAILDAMRPAVESAVKQKVVFKVDRLRAMDGFAFLQAQPLQPSGKPIDYSKTQYADAYDAGAFEDSVVALLRWNGERWRVVKWDIGATDVVWEPWPDETGAPADLFEP